MAGEKRQIDGLTSLRFFLALWVVVYHQIPTSVTLTIPWMPLAPDWVCLILRSGYVAVTAFFVLSGFVLAYNYPIEKLASPRQRQQFWAARFARIYPAYFIGLVALVPILAYRMLRGAPAEYLRGELVAGVLNIGLLQSWVPGYSLTWNYPGWSLSNEVFFYLVFPWVAGWLPRLRGALIGWLAALWLFSLLVPGFGVLSGIPGLSDMKGVGKIGTGEAENWIQLVKYFPLWRVFEFVAGSVAGHWFLGCVKGSSTSRGRFAVAWVILLLGLFFCAGCLLAAQRIPMPLLHNGLLLPGFLCIVIGLAMEPKGLAAVLRHKLLVFLGGASYSLYILHVPVFAYLSIFWRNALGRPTEGALWVGVYLAVVIAVTALFHVLCEEPAHRRLRRWFQERLLSREQVTKAGN